MERTWEWLKRVSSVISLWKALPVSVVAMIGIGWAALASHWLWPVALLCAFASFALVAWGGYAIILINERHGRLKLSVSATKHIVAISNVLPAVSLFETLGGASAHVRLVAINFSPDDIMMDISIRLDSIVENIRSESHETLPAFKATPIILACSITRDQKAALLEKHEVTVNGSARIPGHDSVGFTIQNVPARNCGHLS